MEDKLNEIPEQPEPMHRDLLLRNVDSATARILEDWLQEKAKQEEYREAGDIFSIEIDKLLYSELGVDEVTKRYKKYQDEQECLEITFLKYCEETGYDPDEEAYAEAYPDTDPSP